MTFLLGSDAKGAPVCWDPHRDGDHLWVAGQDDARMDASVAGILGIARSAGWTVFDLDGRRRDFRDRLSPVEREARVRLINKPNLPACMVAVRRLDLQPNLSLRVIDEIAKFSHHTDIHLLVSANPDMRLTERFAHLHDGGRTFFDEFARLAQTPARYDLFEPAGGGAPTMIPRGEAV